LNKQRISGFLIALSAVCLTAAALLSTILYCAFDRGFYAITYARLNVSQNIGMTSADLMKATETLLLYCRGQRDDLDVSVVVEGEQRQAFNPREIAHMQDVKALSLAAANARNLLFALFAALFAGGMLTDKPGILGACRPMLFGLLTGLAAMAAIGLYAALDFGSFWTRFHLLFFTNDLWLLDPTTSLLINMVPEAFFDALVMRILALFGMFMLLITGGCFAGRVLYNRREKERLQHADIGH